MGVGSRWEGGMVCGRQLKVEGHGLRVESSGFKTLMDGAQTPDTGPVCPEVPGAMKKSMQRHEIENKETSSSNVKYTSKLKKNL